VIYEHFAALPDLIERKMISARKHPELPLWIYNYTVLAQFTPIAEWTPAMCDCRGLILDESGNVVGRAFRKFWNYEQVLDRIPVSEPFEVWEKLDGSLGIVCFYQGRRVVSTRGSFESEQARWAAQFMDAHYPDFAPERERMSYLFEIIFPSNRIVVDYGKREDMVLLSIMDNLGFDLDGYFEAEMRFPKARRYDGILEYEFLETLGECPEHAGNEGFVLRWPSGFRAKVKFAEYKRLHRLITSCSTRTIWELLRAGKDTSELMDRVPEEFGVWVREQIASLTEAHNRLMAWAHSTFQAAPQNVSRKDFAEYSKKQTQPALLFLLLDGKPIDDAVWKLVEPKWATPFRRDADE
jgi:RNA ligase